MNSSISNNFTNILCERYILSCAQKACKNAIRFMQVISFLPISSHIVGLHRIQRINELRLNKMNDKN